MFWQDGIQLIDGSPLFSDGPLAYAEALRTPIRWTRVGLTNWVRRTRGD
ncbi:hypothetical protein OAW22_04515 [Pseudomonadales bacterium]|nr:hypothetical protein [Pseudomonadales bacterium]